MLTRYKATNMSGVYELVTFKMPNGPYMQGCYTP